MAGENRNKEETTALIQRDALLGLIDRSTAPGPAYVHTVPRERLRARTGSVQVVDVAPLQRLHARSRTDRDFDELGPSVSPLLVLGVIALLIVTFIAATQLR